MEMDEGQSQTRANVDDSGLTGDDYAAPPAPLFDHALCEVDPLTFDYAREAFASAGLAWDDETLAALHIRTEAGLTTNTTLLISDQCPYEIKCAVFADDTKAKLTERHHLTGSLLRQINEAMLLLNHHNPDETWPTAALREALVNAALHRDYGKPGPTLVSIFATRVEIVSLGGLYDHLEVNDLLNGVSETRNPWLADVFERLDLCENYGTGIQRILESYSESIASPQLRVGPSSFAIVLPKPVLDTAWPGHGQTDEALDDDDMDDALAGDNSTDNGDADGAGDGRTARRYVFPTAHPLSTSHAYITDDASEAVDGSRVIAAVPLTVVLAGEKAWKARKARNQSSASRLAANQSPRSLVTSNPSHESVKSTHGSQSLPKEALPQYSVQSLEAITLHLFSERGLKLTRAQIEQQLGISKNQTAYVLKSLTSKGELERNGRSRATTYSLP
ncbi:ATP-binding protein [Bifidobacterium sp. ESL0790]|uniref:ATP-binding protein n=1 Tax=Bifidobacterium sp. ESL0790 TaxID=2983233 RepID=UPI0023F97178|nr:ATP-binding protein [Bifidobacterium sp. ESL0790]WEV71921.1 transcriptional regulator [Bifidobacterium sp. ESL0790]